VLRSGRWCLHASFGVYGRKGTIGGFGEVFGGHFIPLLSCFVSLDCSTFVLGVDKL
jgi:hypothetical protein